MSTSGVVCVVVGLWVQLSLAHYSLYISEDKLQSYYADSVYAELVQGQIVEIVKDGELQVGDDGSLLLSPAVYSLVSGSGASGIHDMSSNSLYPPSHEALPPLPVDVDTVDFTWVATGTVNYILHVTQQGGQLSTPIFNVLNAGEIPLNPTILMLSVSCLPLSMETGRVDVNLTTSPASTSHSAAFFFRKSCNDENSFTLTTVYTQTSISQENPTSIPTSLTPTPSLSPSYSTPALHLPPPTPSLSIPGFPLSVPASPLLFSDSTMLPLLVSETHLPSSAFLQSTMPSPSQSFSTSLLLSPSNILFSPLLFPPSTFSSAPLLVPGISSSSLSAFTTQILPLQSTPLSSFYTHSKSTLQNSLAPSQSTILQPSFSTTHFMSQASLLRLTHTSLQLLLSTPVLLSSERTSTSLIIEPQSTQLVVSKSTVTPSPVSIKATVDISSSYTMPFSDKLSDHSALYTKHIVISDLVEPSSSVLPTTETADRSNSQLLVLVCAPVGGILLACILFSCSILLCCKCRARGKKPIRTFSDDPLDMVHTVPYSPPAYDMDTKKKAPPPLSLWMGLPWGAVYSLPRHLQTLVGQLGVDRRSLSFLDTIIRGEYGSLVSGQLNNIRTDVMCGSQSVIIKMLTGFPEGSRRDEVIRFIEAATLMKGIQHPHIMSLLRISLEDNYVPLVVYPMVQHGDMYRIIKLAADPGHSILPPLTIKLTLNLAIQIATAMCYLSDHSVIHPDLALRNCLLDSGCTVKVTDAALTQQFYPECYYTLFGATRPVRWAAVETLQEGLCTVRSNVWSYAVTVWEILTFAEMPYSEVNNNRSILSTIKMGARLPRPQTCPGQLYKLLCSCWNDRGEERPNFSTLVSRLQQLMTELQVSDYPQDINNMQQQSSHSPSTSHVKNRHSSGSMGKSVSRERLHHSAADALQARNQLTISQGSLKRISTTSMISRGSTAEKLSVTFSVLSGADGMQSGNDSEEDTDIENGHKVQIRTDQELQSILRQVSTSFVASPIEKTPSPSHEMNDNTNSSINTTTESDISSHTLVSVSHSAKLADETLSVTSSNPVSVTPPPSQTADTHSKTSTMDLESVSTAPYTSSPLQSTSFLYPSTAGNGYGVASNLERGDHSPLLVGHKAHNPHSQVFLPSRPSVKSTDSGIRSDEESELTQYQPTVHSSPNVNTRSGLRESDKRPPVSAVSDNIISSSFMAAFESWDST